MKIETACFKSVLPMILAAVVASSKLAPGQDVNAMRPLTGAASDVDWPQTGNDSGGMRWSLLRQIDKENVRNLQVAWTYHTRDAEDGTNIECTPIVIDGVMYVTTARTRVVAL